MMYSTEVGYSLQLTTEGKGLYCEYQEVGIIITTLDSTYYKCRHISFMFFILGNKV